MRWLSALPMRIGHAAGSVEEASDELARLAAHLQEVVGRFKV